MKPITQLQLLKKMTGSQRVEIAFRLSATTRQIVKDNIILENPGIKKSEINKLLSQRYAAG